MKKLKPNHPDSYRDYAGHLIKERPILFQTEMVKAILEGNKTQTRRTKGFSNENPDQWKLCIVGAGIINQNKEKQFGALFQHEKYLDKVVFLKSPYGKPGDLLWVRETWARIEGRYYFKSDGAEDEIIKEYSLEKINWKPSIHMPKTASRLWLMVEEIRVERVQDISESDSIAEGCKQYDEKTEWLTAKSGFEELWKSINSEASWNSNPWVWVIKYRILSKSGRPSDEDILNNYLEVKEKGAAHV